MRRKAVSGMMLALLLIGMLTLAFDIQPVKTERTTWTLDGDGPTDFHKIQEAIKASPPSSDLGSIKHWSVQAKSDVENELDTRWKEVLQRRFAASGRWDFENEIEWDDFAYVDDDSAELVIGLSEVRPNSYSELVDLIVSYGGEVVNTVSMDGEVSAVVADVPHVAMSNFVSEVEVAKLSRYVEPNMRFELDFVPNDPDWSEQWGPAKIEADDAWDTQTGDPSVLVAVIDSGVDYDHPDLAANYVPLGYDWVNNDPDPMDDHGHGTHCAGIIAATLNNSVGIAGLAQVQIMAEKGLGPEGGRADDLANAIVHAADQGADILSCSWGMREKSTIVHEAMKYAYDHDVLVIGAAGNDATSIEHYPAAYDEVVAVTATDEYDSPAEFTNFGEWVEVAAPGVHIYSTLWDDIYASKSGTSMSAPHVSGVAALIWSQFPSLTRDQVRVQLQCTADDLGDSGFDVYYGHGRVNARRAVEQAPPDHDILVLNLKTPSRYMNVERQATVIATILNMGTSNESGIMVQLLVNGSLVDSKIVGSLVSGASALVSCLWLPTVEGVYNVTSRVVPVPSETVTENNALSAYIIVRIPEVIRVPDDYETVQGAIDAAIDGDTIFVASGTYYENVWINKEGLMLVGEDVSSTIIQGAGVVVAADNVNVNGFTIQDGFRGIETYCSEGSVINNTITLNNEIGIYLLYSTSITLMNNNMTGNSNNLDVDGYYSLSEFIHKVDTSNTVNGKPVYYWINEHDKQVPSDAGYIAAVNSTKIVIKDLNLTDNGEGVLLICTTNSVIENVNTTNNYDGIYLYESMNNNISHNIIIDNKIGISSYYSSDNKINFNKASKNDFGVLIEKSNDNIIDTNEVTNNTYGVYIEWSSYNILRNNNMTRNEYNLGVTGYQLSHFVQDIDTSNTVDGKPIYYWLNEKDTEIPADAGYVAVVNSTNIAIRGLNLTNNVDGVLFAFSSESLIENVEVSNNTCGIYLYSSSNNTIIGNKVTSKSKHGIQVIISNNNIIANNSINMITDNEIGISLWSAENNSINENTVSNCTEGVGLYLDHSGGNSIGNNSIKTNEYGIYLDHSGGNSINNNSIKNNTYGIELSQSGGNTLRNNNMTGNGYNFGVQGASLSDFIQDIDASNTVDGKPIYYWVNQHSQTVPADAGYVAVINSTSITVKNLNLANNLQGVLLVCTTSSTIMNLTASNNEYGIQLYQSNDNVANGNTISDNVYSGVELYYSGGNSINNNSIKNNKNGIRLYRSGGNSIGNNSIETNSFGIRLSQSGGNTLRNNNMTGNGYNFGVQGASLSDFIQDIDASNTVDGKPIYYWVNQHSKTIPTGTGYVAVVNSTSITVKNLNLVNNLQGVLFAYTTNSTIMNVSATHTNYGIHLIHSDGNTITGNTVIDNLFGISVSVSHKNVIDSNIILENGVGIIASHCEDNILSGNKVTGDISLGGIVLDDASTGNTISENVISDNQVEFGIKGSGAGIYLGSSSNNNTIIQNTITNNKYGISLFGNNNTIFRNNFIENTKQAFSLNPINTWDDGYPSGGNYWSDHVCVGNPSDGSQPYIIDTHNVDHYPFQDPNGWLLHQLTVTSSPITGIIFTINGAPKTTPYTKWLAEDSYTLVMPATHDMYVWSHWLEDGDTNRTKTITLPDTTWTGVYVPAPLDVYTQKEPYSGKGLNQPSDAFAPQEEVTLHAYVSYYHEPVANKLVAFEVRDPTGEVWLYRTNSTDEYGVATTIFRIPTTPPFGDWTVYATVDIAEQTANDTLTFKVGWIVEILKVETVDTYGDSKFSFTKGEHAHFNVTVQNIAFTSKEATLTIVVYDECGVPISQVTLQDWVIGPGRTEIFIIDLQIPNWAYIGVATIHANAYTDMPQNGGTPTCPEAYTTFMITGT